MTAQILRNRVIPKSLPASKINCTIIGHKHTAAGGTITLKPSGETNKNNYYFVHFSGYNKSWFPPGLEIRENLEKVREVYSKYWKNWKKLYWKIEKNTGKVREICQSVIVKTLQIRYHTLNKKRTSKNSGKLQKILEKSGKFVSLKKWEPCKCTSAHTPWSYFLITGKPKGLWQSCLHSSPPHLNPLLSY